MTTKFKVLQRILHVIGIINGSYILIIAPKFDPTSYRCRKGFYSVLLQGVVNSKCKFWDYDFRWTDIVMIGYCFNKLKLENKIKCTFSYKSIGNTTYPMKP